MPRPRKNANSSATLGHKAQLWQMPDALRGSMDAACFDLLFLKYISDIFEEKHVQLIAKKSSRANPENPDDKFAGSEFGRPKGGEFYTPRCVVKFLVEMLEPYRGRVHDLCCGSSGVFAQSVEFIRGIDSGQIAQGDTFHNDQHAGQKAYDVLANPPFNISDWGSERLRGDKRWRYGTPPAGNANFAWVQQPLRGIN